MIAGYAGRLATVAGHLEARLDAAKRAERKHPSPKAELERQRAERELERFVARWGNGRAEA